ncbi:MAG: rRNA maturation RNase YbeY, partial [Selenomonadaceae bacterium]|nr:rRNA maturation RNase YbeY [Selenomonadaceae bacterium]
LVELEDPETGELVLGDIVLNVERIKSQAAEYGHTQTRELAFLVAHSMLHLLGYDHMEEEERREMEQEQRFVMEKLGISRET